MIFIIIHAFNISQGSWSLSQWIWGTRWRTPWTACKLITEHTFTHYIRLRDADQPTTLHLLTAEETWIPGGNLRSTSPYTRVQRHESNPKYKVRTREVQCKHTNQRSIIFYIDDKFIVSVMEALVKIFLGRCEAIDLPHSSNLKKTKQNMETFIFIFLAITVMWSSNSNLNNHYYK